MDININNNEIDIDLISNNINVENLKPDISVQVENPNIEIELKKISDINIVLEKQGPKGEKGEKGEDGGAGGYIVLDIEENYIAEQLTGNYLLNCSGEVLITLPTTTEAIFSIRNENGQITITNEVNGEENKVLKYINSSITLISIGDGKYNII